MATLSKLESTLTDLIDPTSSNRPVRVHLAAIVPSGSPFAYAATDDGRLTGLKFAHFRGRSVQSLCRWLYQQKSLERLVLDGTKSDLPPGISALKGLKFLSLSEFRSLPPDIVELRLPIRSDDHRNRAERGSYYQLYTHAMKWAAEEDHRLYAQSGDDVATTEPANSDTLEADPGLAQRILDGVVGITVSGSTIDPPIEIVARGRDAVQAYFSAQLGETAELSEIKLLVVGHGGSGKTSLMKLLSGGRFDPDERQTHGINLKPIDIKTKSGRVVAMKTWDFGGQEIMHATHQFFLSKRSVYVIVLDGRKEEQAEYWLRHVQSFGGDAPTIVVLNKFDENSSFDVNRRFLMQKYPGIIGFVRTSCRTGHGLVDLRATLSVAIEGVELLKTRWPTSWLSVKKTLESSSDAYLGKEAFEQCCRRASIRDKNSQATLAQFLNDLGVIVHFPDFKLTDTHVLSPHWLTGAVYRILTSPELANSGGLMSLTGISELLSSADDQKYPAECHQFIVEIMRKFELCYFVDSERILVPDLLPVEQPAIDLDGTELAVLRYDYADLVPRSVIPRLIVRLNAYVQRDGLWRTGFRLNESDWGAQALVQADYQSRVIEIKVSGSGRRDVLAVIRSEFRHIHRSFEQLSVSEKVPLPDLPSVSVSYEHLLRLEHLGELEVFPDGASGKYNVADLLGSVRVSRRWSEEEFLNMLKIAIADTDDRDAAAKVANDMLLLQPNVFGLGVNINALVSKVFQKRKKDKQDRK